MNSWNTYRLISIRLSNIQWFILSKRINRSANWMIFFPPTLSNSIKWWQHSDMRLWAKSASIFYDFSELAIFLLEIRDYMLLSKRDTILNNVKLYRFFRTKFLKISFRKKKEIIFILLILRKSELITSFSFSCWFASFDLLFL